MKSLIFLLMLVVEASCRTKVLRKSSGSFSSADGDSFSVLIPSGKKIALRIDRLTMRKGGSLKVRNPESGNTVEFKIQASTLYKWEGGEKTEINLPVSLELDANKIRMWTKKLRRFSGRYATFTENSQTCRKQTLPSNATSISCDTDDVIPVADTCNVELPCATNYQQYNNAVRCLGGYWMGRLRCSPKESVITNRCQFDFDEFTRSSECPFTESEIAHYYIDEAKVQVFEQIDRSGGRSIDCSATCARNNNGQWRINCQNRSRRNVYVKCMVCRVMYNCGRQMVIFR